MSKYFVTRRPGDTIHFWQDCRKLDVPFITVEEKLKYSLVSWDCLSLSPMRQQDFDSNSAKIAMQLQRLYREYSNDTSYAQYVEPFVGYIRTEKERACELAERLYDTLTTYGGSDSNERLFPLGVRNAW